MTSPCPLCDATPTAPTPVVGEPNQTEAWIRHEPGCPGPGAVPTDSDPWPAAVLLTRIPAALDPKPYGVKPSVNGTHP